MTSRVGIILVLLAACTGCLAAEDRPSLPGMTRQQGKVFLMENHCNALIAWHSMGITNATLVHMDTHDDFRAVTDEKISALQLLLKIGSYEEVFRSSDTSQFLNLKKKDSELIYDLGNFIYPCIKLGIVSRIYWVVPDHSMDKIQADRLRGIIQHNLPAKRFKSHNLDGGGFSAEIDGVELTVVCLRGLPSIKPGYLLDIDVDYFAFATAMSEDHLIGELSADPEEALATLARIAPSPQAVTISASVWGGYLPLLDRFLADAIFDCYTSGSYPPDARSLLNALWQFRTGNPDAILEHMPTSEVYKPAWQHMNALRLLSKGMIAEAKTSIVQAAESSHIYSKGLLDMAEALLAMKQTSMAADFLNSFESLNDGPSYNSLSIRAMTQIEQGAYKEALDISSALIRWDSNPYTQLIHASALQKSGKDREAESYLKQILIKQPANAPAHFNLGLIAEGRGDTAIAIAHYEQAISSRKAFWEAYEHLGHIQLQLGNLSAAEAYFQRAIAINPYTITSANNLGLILHKQGHLPEAADVFQRALAMNPEHTILRLNYAELLWSQGKSKEAEEICQSLIKQGANTSAAVLLEKIHRHNGMPAEKK